jgi:hypothetical protein
MADAFKKITILTPRRKVSSTSQNFLTHVTSIEDRERRREEEDDRRDTERLKGKGKIEKRERTEEEEKEREKKRRIELEEYEMEEERRRTIIDRPAPYNVFHEFVEELKEGNVVEFKKYIFEEINYTFLYHLMPHIVNFSTLLLFYHKTDLITLLTSELGQSFLRHFFLQFDKNLELYNLNFVGKNLRTYPGHKQWALEFWLHHVPHKYIYNFLEVLTDEQKCLLAHTFVDDLFMVDVNTDKYVAAVISFTKSCPDFYVNFIKSFAKRAVGDDLEKFVPRRDKFTDQRIRTMYILLQKIKPQVNLCRGHLQAIVYKIKKLYSESHDMEINNMYLRLAALIDEYLYIPPPYPTPILPNFQNFSF